MSQKKDQGSCLKLAHQLLETLLEASACMQVRYIFIDWSTDRSDSFFIDKVEALQILGLAQIKDKRFALTPVGLKVAHFITSQKNLGKEG